MAKSQRKSDDAVKHARLSVAAAAAFNLGLLLFVVWAAWDFLGPPSSSSTVYWWKLGLWTAGLAIAGPAWVAGSSFPTSWKVLMSAGWLAVVLSGAWSAESEFEADALVLQPWRVEGNRLIDDGLGLSVVPLPRWGIRKTVEIIGNGEASDGHRDRLCLGEKAIFLRLKRGKGDGSNYSFIIVEGGPQRLRSFKGAVSYVRARQAAFAREPGVKITGPLQTGQIGGAEALQITWEDARGKRWTRIFFRSGSYLLTLTVKIADEADRRPINDFLKSIRVTGRDSSFGA